MGRIFQGISEGKRNDFFFGINKFWHEVGLPDIDDGFF